MLRPLLIMDGKKRQIDVRTVVMIFEVWAGVQISSRSFLNHVDRISQAPAREPKQKYTCTISGTAMGQNRALLAYLLPNSRFLVSQCHKHHGCRSNATHAAKRKNSCDARPSSTQHLAVPEGRQASSAAQCHRYISPAHCLSAPTIQRVGCCI